jgi:hypothetical protein
MKNLLCFYGVFPTNKKRPHKAIGNITEDFKKSKTASPNTQQGE